MKMLVNHRPPVPGRRVRQAVILATALAAAAGLAACGSNSAGTAAASGASTATITITCPPISDYLTVTAAQQKGYFKQENLNVKCYGAAASGATALPLLQSGTLTISGTNIYSMLLDVAHGYPVKCVSAVNAKPATGSELAFMVSKKDAGIISNPSSLAGKSIGINAIGSASQLIAELWLKAHHVNPSSVTFTAVPFPNMAESLASGTITAAITDEPYTTLSIKAGAKVLAARPYQLIAQEPVFNCWAATTSYLARHADVVKRFNAAMAKATVYVTAHPAWLRQALVSADKLSPALAKQVYLPSFTTKITAQDVNLWVTAAMKVGLLSKQISGSSVIWDQAAG